MYDEKFVQKPQIVVLNKLDLPGAQKMAEIFQSLITEKKTIFISALTGQGLEQLKSQIVYLLDGSNE
jgi:50S ribosomal subunit-associated GTPase HflX